MFQPQEPTCVIEEIIEEPEAPSCDRAEGRSGADKGESSASGDDAGARCSGDAPVDAAPAAAAAPPAAPPAEASSSGSGVEPRKQQQEQERAEATGASAAGGEAAREQQGGGAAPAPPLADASPGQARGPPGAAPQQQQAADQEGGAAAAPAKWEPAGEGEAAAVAAAEALKLEGNALFGQQRWDEAMAKYQEALDAAPEPAPQRAVYYANLAACALKLHQPQLAAEHCSCALRLDGGYVKALMRRACAFEELDDLDHALADANKVLELDPSNRLAAATTARLAPLVKERHEKLKDEMLGKLKDLGNTVLGKFGLSLDNFKTEQDPATGGYSIKFSQ
ncbi:MAG: hypothetical protein J3K34DRAFT_28345 [Monoraphidium minutum]|nr:MAG: hypothetical protein J3K34DRAFT_28345 [Monoraphidium minutum]